MDSEDDVSLTSFRPLSPDRSKPGTFLARFFQKKRPEARVEVKIDSSKKHRPVSPLVSPRSSPQLQKRASTSKSPELQRSWSASPLIGRRTSANANPHRRASHGYRNVHAVLGRLNAAADGQGQLRQEYKESDFKQYWMPDENCKECYECGEKFNTFRRRHHCRLCGQIFCYRCCYLEIPGQIMGYTGFLRVCTYCHKVVQRYTQASVDLNVVRNLDQLQADLSVFTTDQDISTNNSGNLALPKTYPFDFDDEENFYVQPPFRKISNSSSMNAISSYLEKFDQKERPSTLSGRRPFDAFGVCAAEADMLKQDSFRELWNQIMSPRSGLELQSHRFRLRTYQSCLVGSELVDWLLTYEKTSTRNQAVMIGQGLLESGWLEPVPNTRDGGAVFKDEYVLYQPGVAAREVSTPKRTSIFWGEDKAADKNESLSESYQSSEHVDDDNDETVPHWFRQLDQHGIESTTEELDASNNHEVSGKLSNLKATGPKLLDLDLMNGVSSEEVESELSLKVDLQHFGEPGKLGLTSPDANSETGGSKLSLITDAPPPPLEQYVYNEGYPCTPLRPSTKKANEGGAVPILSTSNTPDEIFSGAMMARRIGVDRSPSAPDIGELREDNGERLAMERLSTAHAYHLNTLLEQLLKDAGLSVDWKDTILPLVKQVSQQVTPDVRKDDDMDICEYVKFKKIPGGNKSDCEMISGVVFTKNIANKKMASVLSHPKILVLSCAIDYQRNENRLASLDPLVLQEFEFLKNFVARVVSLRPNILLVEKTVSRLAQDMLLQHGITLVLNVKPRVIERIARCTRADVLCSMEQLSRPQLGSCQSFKVQRYPLKNGESKTLMFIDGCPADLGCTINLRGGNSFVLAKVKRIFQHVVFVAYSLRLELQFLMDEFALPPDTSHLIEEREIAARNFEKKMKENQQEVNGKEEADEEKTETAEISQQDSSEGSEVFLTALKSTVLSSSPFLDYPLPYLLTEAGRNFALRSTLPPDIYWSARIDAEHNSSHLTEEDLEEFDFSNPHQRRLSKLVCLLEPHPLTSASLTMEHSDPFFQVLLSDFRAQGGQIQLTRNGETVSRSRCRWLEGVANKTSSQTKEDKSGAQRSKKLSTCVSEKSSEAVEEKKSHSAATSPLQISRKQVDCLDPYAHQRIAVLFISYSNESNNSPRPCISPWAVFMEFYGQHDITLGGFLERYCFRPSYICPNPNCDVPMVDHVRYFAHGTGSVYIHMRNLESPIPGFQHTILTWSWCKECKQVTPIVPLSPEAWAMSFAKYLELRFYAGSYKRRASVEPCGHSLHKDHFQYFAYANMVASFKYRPIKLFEIAIPPPTISIKEKTRDASFWIDDIRAMATRGDTVFAAFYDRLESLRGFFTQPDRQARMQQFFVAISDEHSRFLEQVETVEKKALSLQTPHNPLAVENEESCEHLGPEDRQALEYVIANSLNSLKTTLCDAVDGWNNSLQEYVQAEKKKNNKASSKEGKLLSSSTQIDGKSGEQLNKSPDVIRTVDMNPNEANLSPSLTPWGSRSASPYPSLESNESTGEAISGEDMELLHVNTGFRPIPSMDTNIDTPGDSPTEGILPVGGVVKGHSLPGDTSEPLLRVRLKKDFTASQQCGTFKAFVVIEPNSEELPDPYCETKREKKPSGVKMDNGKEPCRVEMDGVKEPSGVKMAGAKGSPEVKMDAAKGPTGVEMDDSKEPSLVQMDALKASSGVEMGDRSEPAVGNMEDIVADSNEKRSSWYIIEGVNQDSGSEENAEGKPAPNQEQFPISAETKSNETVKDQDKPIATGPLKAKPFTLGHRRVASSPPSVTVSSAEDRRFSGGEDTTGATYLERSRSDSDISAHVKQTLNDSQMSTESNLESLDEDEIDANNKEGMTEPNGADDSNGEESMMLGLRKVNTIPASLYKRGVVRSQSWAVNQWQTTAKKALALDGDSDAMAPTDASTGTTKRGKVKRIVSSFMSSPAFQPVASTFPSHEHHLLPPGEKVLVVVSEKETSSIIAYTLSTTEYNERLHVIQQTLSEIKNEATRELQLSKSEFGKSADVSVRRQSQLDVPYADKLVRVDSGSDSGEGYVHLDIVEPQVGHRVGQDGDTTTLLSSDKLEFMSSVEVKAEPDIQSAHHSKVEKVKYAKAKHTAGKDELKKTENWFAQDGQVQDDIDLVQFGFQRKDGTKTPVDFHVKHQFADNTCRFYCSIYYAEQFRLLRKRIFPDGEEKYIRSLQHSVAWGARGGKSGSAFFKSLDDRFVMKQMSRQELQCFLEFAPHYFRYVNKALDEQRPTLLAKILGIYRIGYKNSQSSATMRQDVLVMENLFYDRKIDKTFDLKGSMRSRYVQTSGMKNDVLLDENLLEMIRECPIFFRPHSKAILSRAIHNDTEFLAQQMVMDYSLLVGIDEARSELVTGIIDFIRTFTWDKKLEMYVKASGILGGQGRMPTVVSPELYRTRFTEAMHRYFLMVPDKWTGLGNDLD